MSSSEAEDLAETLVLLVSEKIRLSSIAPAMLQPPPGSFQCSRWWNKAEPVPAFPRVQAAVDIADLLVSRKNS